MTRLPASISSPRAYEFETFVKAYPKSQKAAEAYFLMAFAHYKTSPNFSLDQTDTEEAIDKVQEFINRYPNDERMPSKSIVKKDSNKPQGQCHQKWQKHYVG